MAEKTEKTDNKENDVMKIVNALSQITSGIFDGAVDKEGKLIKTGLKREKEVDFRTKRQMDGFKVRLSGNKLLLTYHTEILTQDYHKKDFKEELLSTVADVISYLKKEYKKLTNEALSLKKYR